MEDFKKNIIYYDNHLVVAYKPSGMLSQKDKTGDDSILEHVKEFIKKAFDKKGNVFLGSVHRLDRPAEGIMVFAKTSKALERLNKAFRAGEVTKIYWVLAHNQPDHKFGTLKNYLVKDQRRNVVKSFKTPGKDRKEAVLQYELLAYIDNISLVEIHLRTGRPHQIRVQMAGINCPVIGDLKYGSNVKTGDGSICLMSKKMEFIHPVTKEKMCFEQAAPVHKKFWEQFSDI